MHAISFIQDLAVIMLVAGVVTVLFHRLKQPVVLGYIVAGFIIGPHTPPFGLIHDEDTIKTLAELGVIFLMFCLGLEFSLRKLFKVGATAFIAAFLEIVLMIWIGYEIGRWFDWNTMDSLFLGAILAISSTTIIVKALNDLKMKNQRFAQLIFGVLIVEDILGIGIIASMAYQSDRDTKLSLLDVGDLFENNTTRIALRKGYFLRGYAYEFIELCSPKLDEPKVKAALKPESHLDLD